MPERVPSASDAPRAPHRVLLAEDEPSHVLLAQTILERLGCEVDVVASGRDAIERARSCDYDLILMDLCMPEMDGLQATGAIREVEKAARRKQAPVVIITAAATVHDCRVYDNAGANDVLLKPFRIADFEYVVREWLGLK